LVGFGGLFPVVPSFLQRGLRTGRWPRTRQRATHRLAARSGFVGFWGLPRQRARKQQKPCVRGCAGRRARLAGRAPDSRMSRRAVRPPGEVSVELRLHPLRRKAAFGRGNPTKPQNHSPSVGFGPRYRREPLEGPSARKQNWRETHQTHQTHCARQSGPGCAGPRRSMQTGQWVCGFGGFADASGALRARRGR